MERIKRKDKERVRKGKDKKRLRKENGKDK